MTTLRNAHEESLGEFLSATARRLSGERLAIGAIAAALAAAAIVLTPGVAWEIRLGVAGVLLSFNVWGVADRALAHFGSRGGDGWRVRVLRAVRVAAAVTGFAAAAFLMMALLGRALGRIIS